MRGLAEPEPDPPTDSEVPGASGLVLTWAGGPGGPPGGERPRDRTAPEGAPGAARPALPAFTRPLGSRWGACPPSGHGLSLGTGSW